MRLRFALPTVALASLLGGSCRDHPLAVTPKAPLVVGVPDHAAPGQPVFGTNGYVEYIPGNLPVIFSAPHGGGLQPATIPVRTAAACGGEATTVRDASTQELVREIQAAFLQRTGGVPHIVINRLHRDRLDANRELPGAACGSQAASTAWAEYQGFIEHAKATVLARSGRGFFTDVHGHGHAEQRLELGYELTGATLRRSDAELDAVTTFETASSIRSFSLESPRSFSAVLRGPTALGTLLASGGYPSVPSLQDPAPAVGESYFGGGYNTDRHACSRGGGICGVQLEANMDNVRDDATTRTNFAHAIAAVYRDYLAQFGLALPAPPLPGLGDPRPVDDDNATNGAWGRFVSPVGWTNGANTEAVGGIFRLLNDGVAAAGAEFFLFVPSAGTYSMEAWWPSAVTRATSVTYRALEADGTTQLGATAVDQRVDGNRWNTLGIYRFTQPGWARVIVARTAGNSGSVAADAIRLTQLDRLPVTSILHGRAGLDRLRSRRDGDWIGATDVSPLTLAARGARTRLR